MLKLYHGKSLAERYRLISGAIGKNKRVLEIGSGVCMLAGFLDRSNSYVGLELNQAFINYATKKGIEVIRAGAFDFDKYPKANVIVLCDVLHHIYPKHKVLLDKMLKKARTVICCEPAGEHILVAMFDYDGINSIKRDSGPLAWAAEFRSKERLIGFFKNNGAKTTRTIGKDVIAVF
jgi:hypothetical protein